jgi:putative acyl-CoA dehydrogenase
LAGLADAAGPDAEYAARRLAGQITLTLQAALLVRHAPAAVADSFVSSRLDAAGAPGGPGVPFGTLPDGVPVGEILDRARLVPR